MELILNYFNNFTEKQKEQFAQLSTIYGEWNSKINVISRKDMDSFYERHVLHSLAIATLINFKSGSNIIDVGTGGGFPGIPLAIYFPEVRFTLIDSIGKKIKVVDAVKTELNLTNVTTHQTRSENFKGSFDFIVSRAVSDMSLFHRLTKHLISKKQQNALPNGILYLKGGDLTEELRPFGKRAIISDLDEVFNLPFFETKKIVHLPF